MAPVKAFALPIHIVIERDQEIAGRWNAHCLELDLMSWHDSIQGALDMIREAIEIVVVDELAHDRDPALRGATTPTEDWDAMWAKLAQAKAAPVPVGGDVEPTSVVVETRLRLLHITPEAPQGAVEFRPPVAFVPIALSA